MHVDADGLSVVIQLLTMHDGKRRQRIQCWFNNKIFCEYNLFYWTKIGVCVRAHVHARTSLSSEASRCSDLSDMRKLRVVSTIGCGPGFSGAY